MSSSDNIKSLYDFFVFDDSPAINKFIDDKTKVPYWFLIRNSVLRIMLNKQITGNISGARSRTICKIFKMLCVYFFQVTLNFLSFFSILFSKRDVILLTRSESYSNPKRAIYTEDLIERLGIHPTRVISIETDESGAEIFRNKMIIFKSSSIKHILSVVCLLTSKVLRDKNVEAFIEVLSKEVSELDSDLKLSSKELGFLRKELSTRILRNRLMNFAYRILFFISRPKLIICEEGFYQHSVLLNKIASEKQVVTVEMQHGVVHPNHDAYNYSDNIIKEKNLKGYFPDLFLTWGQYWEENIRIPSKFVTVGFPYRSKQLISLPSSIPCKLLVLGDGANTEKYLVLCEALSKKVDLGYEVAFRPHPMERVLFETNSEERRRLSSLGIYVDLDRNLYHSLTSSSIVISEMSTCLFEAIGLVDRILVWRTDVSEFVFRKLPFEGFLDLEDLTVLLTQNRNGSVNYETSNFWAEKCDLLGVDGLLNEAQKN